MPRYWQGISNPAFLTLLWATGSAVACVFAMSWLPAAYDGTNYYPLGADSFYHARRILDTLADPSTFYQFDPNIHAPQGSLLTWPWAYNWLAAHILRIVARFTDMHDPMAWLVYFPVAGAAVNCAAIVLLGRAAGLGRYALMILVLAYACAPLTRELHAVGRIDHHYIEHLFFLLSVVAVTNWINQPTRWRALWAGCVLGLAPGFHNGLFVLQALMLAGVGLVWLRGQLALRGTAATFVAAMLISSALVLLPSAPFRQFEWAFYYLGWFHLSSVALTCLLILGFARFRPSLNVVAAILVATAALGVAVWAQIDHGFSFLFAEMPALRDVSESESLLSAISSGRAHTLDNRYTALVWFLPLVVLGLGWVGLKSAKPSQIVLAVMLLGGLFLMLQQLRLHYFGFVALLLSPLMLSGYWARTGTNTGEKSQALDSPDTTSLQCWRRRAFAMLPALVVLASLLPALHAFGGYPPLAGDRNYAINRPVITALASYCKARPGVVLATFGDGHYLRYHTDCQVIANNMIMTPQHLERIALTETLLDLTPHALRSNYPWINYVYVWQSDSAPRPLVAALTGGERPDGFVLLAETAFDHPDGERVIFARAWRIVEEKKDPPGD